MENNEKNELLQENKKLKEEIERLRDINEDYLSYKLFTNAKKKIITWISIALVIFTAFGIISINSLVNTIRVKVEEAGTENIIESIKTGFIKEHQETVTSEVVETLNPFIEAKVEELIRSEMTTRLQEMEKTGSQKNQIDNFSKAFKKTYEGESYIVIGGSSPREKDLKNLLIDIEMRTGNDPKEMFPNLYIRKSDKEPHYYMLILEENISFEEARKARDKALHFGFRSDTFFKKL